MYQLWSKDLQQKIRQTYEEFLNVATVEVTFDRYQFAKHGLQLNRKGREQAAKTIVSSIKEIFKLQKKDSIKWAGKKRKAGRS